MKKLKIKNCIFGDEIPKICIPIVGRTEEEILSHAHQIRDEIRRLEKVYEHKQINRVDVIEFRADYYENVCDCNMLIELIKKIRSIFDDRLLLFTYRSEEEGGELRHDRAENMVDDIYDWVIASGLVDMVDIELMSGNYRVVRIATKAHDKGMAVVMSNHDFEKTPRDDELIKRIHNMEILGGDILKIAVMPKNEFEVTRLMELTEKITKDKQAGINISHPLVTMSMGEKGRKSRVSGRVTGSAITFAAVGMESAPGQIKLDEMFDELNK